MAAERRPSHSGERKHGVDVEVLSLAGYASREYLLELGWRTTVRDGEVLLDLDDDMTAVVLPSDWALMALADLRAMRLYCPVVMLPDGAVPHCVFLLEKSPQNGELPWLWQSWPAGEGVPLPIGHSLSSRTWLRPPQAGEGGTVTVAVLASVLARLLDGRVAGTSVSPRRTA